jgi:hypothetical protein
MKHYTTLGSNLKRGILRFSEKICEGLTRPGFKFVAQMVYGILAAQSCQLSKIARALDERITLKKTIDRLSRNLREFDGGERLHEKYISKMRRYISKRTIFVVDDSDITKPCSKKLECLGTVRDGSTGEMGTGYHTVGVIALTPEKKQPIGVYNRVYSAEEAGFVSADDETLKALKFLGKHFGKNNVRAFDRGYDANVYYEHLTDNREKFIIRAKKNRDVIYKGKRVNILKLANRFKGKYCLQFKRKNGLTADCKISIVPINLPCRPDDDLNLVVCFGFGNTPLMLITNLKSDDDRLCVTVVKVYLMRWRIEEFYGFKKQQFAFEDFRVRSMASIRNLDLLLTVAIGYIGMMSEKADERATTAEVIAISKRIYGVNKFLFYAIADGLRAVFSKCAGGIAAWLRFRPPSPQLPLWRLLGFNWG